MILFYDGQLRVFKDKADFTKCHFSEVATSRFFIKKNKREKN